MSIFNGNRPCNPSELRFWSPAAWVPISAPPVHKVVGPARWYIFWFAFFVCETGEPTTAAPGCGRRVPAERWVKCVFSPWPQGAPRLLFCLNRNAKHKETKKKKKFFNMKNKDIFFWKCPVSEIQDNTFFSCGYISMEMKRSDEFLHVSVTSFSVPLPSTDTTSIRSVCPLFNVPVFFISRTAQSHNLQLSLMNSGP